jgi:hypothetical protein
MGKHRPNILFYVGIHEIPHAEHLQYSFISINRIANRKSDFKAQSWIMDSAAFTRITTHGQHHDLLWYVEQIRRWSRCGTLDAAVSQDYMCEPFVLEKTGKSVSEHQALTIERYAELKCKTERTYLMPVLQGYAPEEYASHVRQYGALLKHNAWVGVGGVCKRNSNLKMICAILRAIKREREDLLLHGFGLKQTALADGFVRRCLFSADSMAWSFAARYSPGKNSWDMKEAITFADMINKQPIQETIW